MAKKKETWGFDTPSAQAEQWLDEAKRIVDAKDIDWRKELYKVTILKAQADGIIAKEMVKPESERFGLAYAYDLSRDWYITALIIKLGLDIVTLSKQVTDMQKMLKDMKLAIKC